MKNQLTFADSEYNQKRRQSSKERFLGRMEKLIPWKTLCTRRHQCFISPAFRGQVVYLTEPRS